MSEAVTNTIIRQIESMGYTINRITLLLECGKRYRFTAWLTDENPGGVYRVGEQWIGEAESRYLAVCQLAELIGLELDDG